MQIAEKTYADEFLCCALDIGEHLLRCGAEVSRVEDTIARICRAFGAVHVEVNTITVVIVASVQTADGTRAMQMRRVFGTNQQLSRIEEYNTLSRRICAGELTLAQAREQVEKIKAQEKTVPLLLTLLGYFFAAGGFAVFFGGSVRDGLCAALVGVLMGLCSHYHPRALTPMVLTLVLSLVGGCASLLLTRVGLGQHPSFIMIGTIMPLIPGLAATTSLREMLDGDIASGALRLLSSLLITGMIALGYGIALVLLGGGLL